MNIVALLPRHISTFLLWNSFAQQQKQQQQQQQQQKNNNIKDSLFGEHSCTPAEAHFDIFALELFYTKVLELHNLVSRRMVGQPEKESDDDIDEEDYDEV